MQKVIKCPACKKELGDTVSLKKEKIFPFCSEKCKMSDLYGWFTEEFKLSRELEPRDIADLDLSY